MDDIVIFGLILLGVGVGLILIGIFSKASESEEKPVEPGQPEMKETEEPPITQRKSGPEDVLNKMQKDENFRKEVYSIIKENKERQK